MTGIRDALHGHITLNENERAFIQDKNMQRLRHVSQFGFASLVYPGANHTRFEHSIGTMHITKEMLSQVNSEKEEECIYAGLLHDIGHGPFSHHSDNLIKKYLKSTHEELGIDKIKNSSIKDIIQGQGLSMKTLLEYFNGKGKGEIITGPFGSDRMDYLVRDAHYSGVAFGSIDYQYIRAKLTLYKGAPAIMEQGTNSLENFLLARYSMFSAVYDHHTAVIAEGMYERAVENAIEAKKFNPEELKELTDWQMRAKLTTIKESKELMQRLNERDLFKRVFSGYVDNEPNIAEIENELEKLGIRRDNFTVKLRRLKIDGGEINVVTRDGKLIGKFSELSPLVKTLTTLHQRKKLIIACDRKDLEKAKKVLKKL